jgi:CheY-like chemotaxis protein
LLPSRGIDSGGPFAGEDGHSILLIDDDDFGRHTLARILEGHGYQVVQAANGAEGMRCLHAVPRPALVVLDPLTRRCDSLLGGIPIIVVSAAESLAGLPESVVAHFEKPIAVRDLLAAIRRNLTA